MQGQYFPLNVGEPVQFIEVYDYLDVHKNSRFDGLVTEDEIIYFSAKLIKINKRLVPQERFLIITDKALYNIHPRNSVVSKIAFGLAPCCALRRKIKAEKIFAMTVSGNPDSDQFVIHVDGEYDYRYDGLGKRSQVAKVLLRVFHEYHNDYFHLYVKDEADLAQYHTTDDDFKKGIIKRPRDGVIEMPFENLDKSLRWIIKNRKNLPEESQHYQWVQPPVHDQSTQETQPPSMADAHLSQKMAQEEEEDYVPAEMMQPYKKFDPNRPITGIEDITMTNSLTVQIAPRKFGTNRAGVNNRHSFAGDRQDAPANNSYPNVSSSTNFDAYRQNI